LGLRTLKDVTTLRDDAAGMHRHLGAWQITVLGVAATIGAGIFVMSGTVAAHNAGPAVALSFVLAGLACLCAALCYAEFASTIAVAGSAYTYAYASLGELVAWIIGWSLVLEYLFSAATVSVGWSAYLTAFLGELGIQAPLALTSAPFRSTATGGIAATGALINLPAVAITFLTSGLLYIGIRESARAANIMVAAKVGVILAVIGFGAFYVHPSNWTPFVPANTGTWGHFGASGVLQGAAIVFFAYIGFDMVSTSALEARNPKRDVPIGILGGLAITSFLYLGMCLVLTGMTPYPTLGVAHPVFVAIQAAGPALAWLAPLVNIAAILGLASAMLMSLYGQTRIFYTMSVDGLLPPVFSRLHPKFRTPHIGTLLVGAAVALVGGLLPIETLGELASIGTLLAFAIVCGGVLVLRRRHPDMERPFRVPFSPFVPMLGILSCGGLMATLPAAAWIRLVVWTSIGLAIYVLYGRSRSVAARAEAGGH
jgi:APA family basic amino acid/polyamine antiporter